MLATSPVTLAGRYSLDRIVGRGGMAVVYAGVDRVRGGRVAIQVLDPTIARRPKIRARHEQEAQTMAALHHPNVVALRDVGQDGDNLFLVMEYLDGGSVWDRLRVHGPLPPRTLSESL